MVYHGFVWRYCVPRFLTTMSLGRLSLLCGQIHTHVQPQLDRLKWWTYGEEGWQKGYRLRFKRSTNDHQLVLPKHLTHIDNLSDLVELPASLQFLTFFTSSTNHWVV